MLSVCETCPTQRKRIGNFIKVALCRHVSNDRSTMSLINNILNWLLIFDFNSFHSFFKWDPFAIDKVSLILDFFFKQVLRIEVVDCHCDGDMCCFAQNSG